MAAAKKDIIFTHAKKFLVSFMEHPDYFGTFGQQFYKVSLYFVERTEHDT